MLRTTKRAAAAAPPKERAGCNWTCAATSVAVIAACFGYLAQLGTPDVSHLPPLLRPHRPPVIAVLNGAGGFLIRAGLMKLPTPEEAIASACREARLPPSSTCTLDLPGDNGTRWRDGLRRLLDSYAADSKLTALGHLIARGQLEQWLVARIRLLHAWRALPPGALEVVPVARPIFIAGLPRTGTTFLLNLLKQDPRLRTPLHHELVEPIAAYRAPAAGTDEAVAAIEAKLEQYKQLLPGFDEMHPMEARMAEECTVTMAMEFASLLFEATFDVSSYVSWLLDKGRPGGDGSGHAHVFAFHRRMLQQLQVAEAKAALPEAAGAEAALAAARAARRWVLKSPWFLHTLDEIAAEYPDAHIIHTHRAPAAVVASSSSMHAKTYGAGSDDIDLRQIGRQQLATIEAMVEHGMRVRARWSAEEPELAAHVSDVQLDELKRDPIGTVERVYKELGIELTDEVRRSMRGWLDAKQVRHGAHAVSLSDYGLDASEMMRGSAVFRRYCDEFRVRGCEAE